MVHQPKYPYTENYIGFPKIEIFGILYYRNVKKTYAGKSIQHLLLFCLKNQ